MFQNSFFLFFIIFLAGFVDSIAGGGGLLSLTGYYAYGLNPISALSNNKFSSTFGTLFSVANYFRGGAVEAKTCLFGILFSLSGSFIGSSLATIYSDVYFRYLMMVAIPVVTLLTIKKKSYDSERKFSHSTELILIASFSFIIGMYDGFFGPGTGMFLTLSFSFVGFSLLEAAGNSKVLNLASNVIALFVFIRNGSVNFSLGIPCAAFSIAGNILGSSLALKFNTKIIKPMLLTVLALLYLEVLNVF